MQIPEDVLKNALTTASTDETVKFYFIRDGKHPIATVCILKQEKDWYYRGISFCSEHDVFDKRTGRFLALQRARGSRDNHSRILRYFSPSLVETMKVIQRLDKELFKELHYNQGHCDGPIFKSKRTLVLTTFEKKIFTSKKAEAA